MSYRFKEPGSMGSSSKFDDHDDGKPGSMDDPGHRPSFGRGRRSPGPGRDRPREFGFGRDEIPMRDRSPLRGGFEDRFQDRFKRDENPYPRRDEMRKEGGRPFPDDPYRDRFMGSMEGRGRFEGGFSSRFDSPDDPGRNRSMNYPGAPYKGYYKNDMVKPNECEIIIVNKQQRAYGENIEMRMKNLGMLVDILFLKDEALLVQTIDDIARRGCLYAMVVSPLNETHRSVTLNILYGTPQEHRNMPLDDALKLVSRNYHDHIRSQLEIMDRDRLERGIYSGSFPADREIQFLLKLLIDGRQLSIAELDTVIRFLTERRDKMKGPEPVSAPAPSLETKPIPIPIAPKDDIDIAKKEQDLQNRILNIMNQGVASDAAQNSAPPAVDLGQVNKPVMQGMSMDNTQLGGAQNMGMMNRSPMGQQNQGMGPNRPAMGMPNNPPMGMPNNPPMGIPNNPQTGQNQSGMGPNNSNLSPMHGNKNQSNPTDGNQQQTPSSQSSTYINFDNPSVQKALDNLMLSGPNILKNISLSATSSPSPSMNNPPPKMSTSNIGPQRVGDNMGMGNNMGGPQRSGPGVTDNMGMGNTMGGQQRVGPGGSDNMGMGNTMGGSQRSGPGSSDNMGMGNTMGGSQRGGPGSSDNMGMSNTMGGPGRVGPGGSDNIGIGNTMGPHPGSFQGQPGPGGMYGAGAAGNMMGNRPPFMGGPYGGGGGGNMMGNRPPFMGGPMSNQGMGGPMGNQGIGGGGLRRY